MSNVLHLRGSAVQLPDTGAPKKQARRTVGQDVLRAGRTEFLLDQPEAVIQKFLWVDSQRSKSTRCICIIPVEGANGGSTGCLQMDESVLIN